jgi:hypothetical protein
LPDQPRSAQAEEGQDREDHDHEADEIDDRIHVEPSGLTLRWLNKS